MSMPVTPLLTEETSNWMNERLSGAIDDIMFELRKGNIGPFDCTSPFAMMAYEFIAQHETGVWADEERSISPKAMYFYVPSYND